VSSAAVSSGVLMQLSCFRRKSSPNGVHVVGLRPVQRGGIRRGLFTAIRRRTSDRRFNRYTAMPCRRKITYQQESTQKRE